MQQSLNRQLRGRIARLATINLQTNFRERAALILHVPRYPSSFPFACCPWLEYLCLGTALELHQQFFIATSFVPSHRNLASRFFLVRPHTFQELSKVLTDHTFHLRHVDA
jgi:hypothetical protein